MADKSTQVLSPHVYGLQCLTICKGRKIEGSGGGRVCCASKECKVAPDFRRFWHKQCLLQLEGADAVRRATPPHSNWICKSCVYAGRQGAAMHEKNLKKAGGLDMKPEKTIKEKTPHPPKFPCPFCKNRKKPHVARSASNLDKHCVRVHGCDAKGAYKDYKCTECGKGWGSYAQRAECIAECKQGSDSAVVASAPDGA